MPKNQRELPPYLRVIKGGAEGGRSASEHEPPRGHQVRAEDIESELVKYIAELVAMLRPHIPENSDFPRDDKSLRTRIGILLWNLRLAMQHAFPEGIPLAPESIERIAGEFDRMEVKYPDPIDKHLLPPLREAVITRITQKVVEAAKSMKQ